MAVKRPGLGAHADVNAMARRMLGGLMMEEARFPNGVLVKIAKGKTPEEQMQHIRNKTVEMPYNAEILANLPIAASEVLAARAEDRRMSSGLAEHADQLHKLVENSTNHELIRINSLRALSQLSANNDAVAARTEGLVKRILKGTLSSPWISLRGPRRVRVALLGTNPEHEELVSQALAYPAISGRENRQITRLTKRMAHPVGLLGWKYLASKVSPGNLSKTGKLKNLARNVLKNRRK